MKIVSVLKRSLEIKSPVKLLLVLLFLIALSCHKDEFDRDLIRTGIAPVSALNGAGMTTFFAEETFTITTKDDLAEIRILGDPDYFEKLFILVQNGNSGKTKVAKIEILIDDVPVVTFADFRKNLNTVQKEVSLEKGSVLKVKIDGSKGRFIKVKFEGSLKINIMSDIDGNFYHTVKIGDLWWMAENLRTTRYNDGTPIELNEQWYPYDYTDKSWYCFYNNDNSYKDVYGALYSNPVAFENNEKQVCPAGWHVSNFDDLLNAVHSVDPTVEIRYDNTFRSSAGGEFKETGLQHWINPNTDATNSTGFTGLPGGQGIGGEEYYGMGYWGVWWIGRERYFKLGSTLDCVYFDHAIRCYIRCVKNH